MIFFSQKSYFVHHFLMLLEFFLLANANQLLRHLVLNFKQIFRHKSKQLWQSMLLLALQKSGSLTNQLILTTIKLFLQLPLLRNPGTITSLIKVQPLSRLRRRWPNGLPKFGDIGSHFFKKIDNTRSLIFPKILIHNGFIIIYIIYQCFVFIFFYNSSR